MSAYKKLDISQFGRLLSDIIIVGFRYNIICGKNPNDIERVYNNIATHIYAEINYNREQLKDIYVDDNEFITVFTHKVFTPSTRNNRIVKYILGKYERFKGGTRDVSLSSETDTLEHILPQNPGLEWGDNNYDFDSLIYRIGNICLLEKNFNRDLENRPYNEKCEVYLRSAFETTRSIPDEFQEWNRDTINQRQLQMANSAKGIWKIDF